MTLSSDANGNRAQGEWNVEHETHLQDVLANIKRAVTGKYRDGQRRHGGHLWKKAGMLGHAEQEITDLNVYMVTLRAQLCECLGLLRGATVGEVNEGIVRLARILGEPEE
jgi:hypothetical protein